MNENKYQLTGRAIEGSDNFHEQKRKSTVKTISGNCVQE